jgi:hypothetical protein
MVFTLKDSYDSKGKIIMASQDYILNLNAIKYTMNTTNQQNVLIYGLWLTVLAFNKTSQNAPVTQIYLRIKQPDGLVIFDQIINLNQKYNLLNILPLNVQANGVLLPNLVGSYIFTFRNASIKLNNLPDNQTYNAIIELSFLRDYMQSIRVYGLGTNLTTTSLPNTVFQPS